MNPLDTVFKDFQRELSTSQFAFHDIVTKKKEYLDQLYKEFELLVPRPKFYLYFSEFISDEEWAQDRMKSSGYTHVSNSKEVVAGHFVAVSELESKARRLHVAFSEMIVKEIVEEKYFGRYLEDMETYKTLERISNYLDDFKQYVFTDDNINNYRAYSHAAAKKIILQINKLNIESLKLDLLEYIVEISIDTDFKLLLWLRPDKSDKHVQLRRNFNYLKTHADELFVEEILKLKNTLTNHDLDTKWNAFKLSEYASMGFNQLISEGESRFIEFKRTLKIDLETNKPGNKPKHAIAKTLAAFLNSGGGVLLIGVDDNKNVIGLEADFKSYKVRNNLDKFKNEFDELISSKLGSNYHHLINLNFYSINGKQICVATVEGSKQPVYSKNESNTSEEFYIRRQASTIALKIKEVTPYIKSHWT